MNKSETEKNHRLLSDLIRWFKVSGRELPWRNTRDPYDIWISEVILQQTQVSRGIEYYQRFLKRFPTVERLASARWSSVLSVWRGLGYYQRARNLMKSAKLLIKDFDGKLPQTRHELLRLPGIGEYTASAICSFAFNRNVPAIDTNLSRVFQRVYGCPAQQVKARAEALFQLRPRSSRKLNYALMDLGALVCRAKSPRCSECPLALRCHYKKHGVASNNESPRDRSRETQGEQLPRIDVAVGCINRNGKYLLAKTSSSKGDGWEFPGGKCHQGETVREALKREVYEELGVEVSVRPAFHVEIFAEGLFEWRIHFCRCQILAGRPSPKEHDHLQWIDKEDLSLFKMPSANTRAVQMLSSRR